MWRTPAGARSSLCRGEFGVNKIAPLAILACLGVLAALRLLGNDSTVVGTEVFPSSTVGETTTTREGTTLPTIGPPQAPDFDVGSEAPAAPARVVTSSTRSSTSTTKRNSTSSTSGDTTTTTRPSTTSDDDTTTTTGRRTSTTEEETTTTKRQTSTSKDDPTTTEPTPTVTLPTTSVDDKGGGNGGDD